LKIIFIFRSIVKNKLFYWGNRHWLCRPLSLAK